MVGVSASINTMSHSIGSAAQVLGITPDTLRYYEKLRLLPPAARNAAGQRVYRDEDLARLRFVKRAQALGFTLADIRQLLRLRENPVRSRRAVRELAQRKCDALKSQLRAIGEMHAELTRLLKLCTGTGECCPIMEQIDRG